nr:hypothetical protein Q903MT_gene2099 [Picea sitchensis]
MEGKLVGRRQLVHFLGRSPNRIRGNSPVEESFDIYPMSTAMTSSTSGCTENVSFLVSVEGMASFLLGFPEQ